MQFLKLTALALATTALAASGCGSSSKTTSTTTEATTNTTETTSDAKTPTTSAPPAPIKVATVQLATGRALTKSRWIAAGDAICARVQTQLAANPVKRTKTFAIVFPQAAALERAEVSELAKLVPPPSDAKDWQTILTKSLESAENTAALGKAAQAGEFTLKSPLVVATTKIRNKILIIAKRDGFKHCGSTAT